MRKYTLILALVLVASNLEAKILAEVNKMKITDQYLNQKYMEVELTSLNPPSKKEFLEQLINFHLVLDEARKGKVESNPQFQEMMKQKMVTFWLDSAVAKGVKKIKVKDADMASFYKEYPDLHLKQIMLFVSPEASKKEKMKIAQRAKYIHDGLTKKTRTFEDYVRIYSDDKGSKKNGGDIGPLAVNAIHPNLYKSAIKLIPGEFTLPIRTNYGYHIVSLVRKVPYAFADKGIVRLNVFEKKKGEVISAYYQKLRKKHKVSYLKDKA